MKECTKCHIKKEVDLFPKNKLWCKDCKNKHERERRAKDRQTQRDEYKKYYEKKKLEDAIVVDTNITKLCTNCKIEKPGSEFYLNGLKNALRSECKKCSSNRRKSMYKKNKKKIIKQTSNYTKQRMKIDPAFKLERRLRTRLYYALQSANVVKKQRTMKYVQCTPSFLENWLSYQLYDGMTLENYGKVWHVDHCKPCALFDFSDEKQIFECFHWSNLRPYLSTKNLKKHTSYTHFDSVLQEIKVRKFLKERSEKQPAQKA
jgi:hypothetical protein